MDLFICQVIYFIIYMVLIDASVRWFHVYLLSIHNVIFAGLLLQITRLGA